MGKLIASPLPPSALAPGRIVVRGLLTPKLRPHAAGRKGFRGALILVVGAHYTYARVPLGFWVQDWTRAWLHLARNHYDRLGHLAQGFVPAILTREILLRCSPLRRGK